MPPPSRAHLLLPTPLGLVRYDLLDEATFLGPGDRGGLTASATPFRKAKAALTHDGTAFRVRALPGEPAPVVNGTTNDGARLQDGDAVNLAGEVVVFRGDAAAPRAVVPPVAAPPAARPTEAAPAAPDEKRGSPAAMLSLLGAGLVLVAIYRAVRLLGDEATVRQVPSPPVVAEPDRALSRAEDKAAQAYAAAQAYERSDPADVEGAVARYRDVVRQHAGLPEATAAALRVDELWARAAEAAWASARPEAESLARSQKFGAALAALRAHEARFSGTPSGDAARAAIVTVREQARAALERLKAQVAPFLTSEPSRAYRMLTSYPPDLPADLETELTTWMARARELAAAAPPEQRPPPVRPPVAEGPGGAPTPPAGGPPTPGPSPAPGLPPPPSEADARELWGKARVALGEKRWKDAYDAYDGLLARQEGTDLVKANRKKIESGRTAADARLRGPPALLRVPSTWKDGRLAVEYGFDDPAEVASDFLVEQPFPGNYERQAEVADGMALLGGSTALLHVVVFETDVKWEAEVFSDAPHDFGLLALQDAKPYRAVSLEAANTQKKLAKGEAAKVLAGHVLWLFGDGAWSATDPGELGFIKLAHQTKPALAPAKKIRLSLSIRSGHASGEIRIGNEAVTLAGAVKGDDGKGIESLRVGAYVFTSVVGLERLKIDGKVDMAWFERRVTELGALDTGP